MSIRFIVGMITVWVLAACLGAGLMAAIQGQNDADCKRTEVIRYSLDRQAWDLCDRG